MKKLLFTVLSFVSITTTAVHAQSANNALMEKNRLYAGATATKPVYHAIYQLDTNDPKVIEKAFRNMTNALSDPRLSGKIEMELVTLSAGTDVILKGSRYEEQLRALVQKGVIVAQCNNTLKDKKITPDQLYDFIAVVPSGNGELIIRAADGWTIIKP